MADNSLLIAVIQNIHDGITKGKEDIKPFLKEDAIFKGKDMIGQHLFIMLM
jgi:hypothetical protein